MKIRSMALCTAMAAALAAPPTFAQVLRSNDDTSRAERLAREEWRDERREEWREDRREARREARRESRDLDDTARVVATQPIYSRDSRQECWNPRAGHYEEVREQNRTRIGKGAALGAAAGGVLGHQVDSGTGTVAGAVIGGLLGHQVQKRGDRDTQDDLDFSRCRVASGSSGDIEGYAVRYEHEGREFVTRLDRDPGDRLRLGRDVNRDGTPYDNIAYDTTRPDAIRR